MPVDLPTIEPTEFIAGSTVEWLISEDGNYPIATWTLSYAFINKNKQFEVICTDNGDGNHKASIPAATSALLPIGDYRWQSYISDGTDRYPVSAGRLKIKPNYADLDGGFDDRTHWRVVLENVEAVIQGRATKDQSSYTIAGRQLSRTPMEDLIMLYDRAKFEVSSEERREAIEKGLGNTGVIKLRFM